MKEGWTYKKLGEVATFMSGYTPDKSELFPQGKYPYFKVAEMNNPGNELFMRNTSLYIDSPKKVFPKGSIIFPKNGGAIYTEKKRILEYDSVIDLNSEAISPNGQIVLKYLFCFLNHIKISSFDKGGGLPSLDLKKMANSLIPLPSLSEQQRIVSRIDSAFAHIDELKANAEKQLSEARTLFQKALTKAMEPKEGWEKKTLKETCSVITDGTHHSPINTADGKYKYVTAKNIRPWGLDLSNITFVSEEVHKEIVSRCCPQKGDVLYIKDGATTGIAIVNPLDEEFSMLSSVALIRPRKDILLSEYLCHALNSPSIYEQTRNQMDGAAITRVTLVKIKGFTIPIPPLSEQHRIVSRLDSLSAHVRELEEVTQKTIAECDALKQALLRKVFE